MKKFNSKFWAVIFTTAILNIHTALGVGEGNGIRDYFATPTSKGLNFTNITNNILGTIIWIGYAIAVCVVLIMGIQFLMANAQKRAMLKEKLWLVFIGLVILVAGLPIIKLAINLIDSAF